MKNENNTKQLDFLEKKKENQSTFITYGSSVAWNYYISGFVDGEGCFTVSFRLLARLKTGIEVRPSFSIAQKKSKTNYLLLKKIRDTLTVGSIRDDGNGCYKYEIRSLSYINLKIIPFFKVYKLYTDKTISFNIFSDICSRMEKGEHLSFLGLKNILTLSENLNPSGTKRYSRKELILKIKNIKKIK